MKREIIRALFHVGVEELGSITSYMKKRSSTNTAFATEIGVEITNAKGETVIVPYSNVRSVKCAMEKE